MKTSKRILSAILALCMVFGCFAAGFSAQAADAALQAGINAAIANGEPVYKWTGGNVTLENTVVVNGDIKVDFNNATVTGAPGKTVVNVKGGNVELYNGTFIAQAPAYQGATGFVESLLDYKPAVSINGGNVTLECITAVGSILRVPNSSSFKVTNGNAINANSGAVVLKDVIACGMKALDNTKADVTIEDAVLVGIYKAVNILDKAVFADGYTQYKTVDILEAFLKDGVSLSATEKKYINGLTNSEGDLSVGSVIVSVKDPSFTEPTSEYDADADVLTVIAKADAANVNDAVANRYSYRYTPDTCTIDGVTADFAEQADGTFAATFENIAADATLDAELEYNLSFKLGKQQKDVVLKAVDMAADYVERAPEIIGRFIEDFEGERAYGKVNDYINLLYGAYQDTPLKNEPAFKKFMGVIYALRGMNFTANTGNIGTVTQILNNKATSDETKRKLLAIQQTRFVDTYGAIFDTDGDGVADSTFAFNGEWGEGLGLLNIFDEHYEALKGLLLTADYSDFNDVGGAAEYVGTYYNDAIALVDAAVELVEYALELLEDPDLKKFLGDNIGDISKYIDYAEKALAEGGLADKVLSKFDKLKNSEFLTTYADRAPELCKRYALKAFDIAKNPTKYFEINAKVEGDFINVLAFAQTAQFTTPSDEVYCNVTVKVEGYGMFEVDGKVYSMFETFSVPAGEIFTVTPVELEDGLELFREYFYAQPNTSWKVAENMDNFRVGSDITIVLNFSEYGSVEDEDASIVFLTDGNLSYNWIGDHNGAVEDLKLSRISLPEFKGLEFAGWSLDREATADDALDNNALMAAIDGRTDDFFVYAVYANEQDLDIPEVGEEDIAAFTADTDEATRRVYFLLTLGAPENVKVIEAGIIATKDATKATDAAMTVALKGQAGVLVSKSETYGEDGYILNSCYHNYGVGSKNPGTIYGRGYVIYKDLNTGAVETVYTDILSGTLS